MFVKGETSGGLTASSLQADRALTWEAKDLSSTLSLSLCPAWSHLLPSHLVTDAAAQCGWRASWLCGGPAALSLCFSSRPNPCPAPTLARAPGPSGACVPPQG